jgi:lipopolysaccharide biosynthesis regulator YciM
MLSVLPIARKYCMDKIEAAILKQFGRASATPGYVDLMVAAQIVGSQQLYQQALDGLISTRQHLSLAQAQRIEGEATFAVLAPSRKECSTCTYGYAHVTWTCNSCHRTQN